MMILRIFVVVCSISMAMSARILGIHPLQFKSHYYIMSPVFLELAKRGHNVTVITSITQTKPPPTYHEIKVDPLNLFATGPDGQKFNFFNMRKKNFVSDQKAIWDLMQMVTDESLKSPNVQALINDNSSQFDVVICEEFFIQAYYMFAHKYKAPLILITPFGSAHYISNFMGNPLELSANSHEFHWYFGELNIWQRINTVLCTWWDIIVGSIVANKYEEIAGRHFKNLSQPLPSVKDLQRNASLVLLNTHYAMDSIRPYVPSIIEVGGMHVKKPKALPPDLQKVLDNAKNGVVYFNLGSNLRSSDLPADKLQAFLSVFSKLNETVLWKWEDENIKGQPANVVVRKWMPQNDVLAHPNIKLFITHGGLLGAQEAIYHGVPIVGMPIFGDQYRNIAKAKHMGYGESLYFDTLSVDSISSALNKVLLDPSYRIKAKKYSEIFRDTPQTAMERAIYWIEYVIRHKGAKHLKPTTVWMTWYQYYLLDVMLIILLVTMLMASALYSIYKMLFSHYYKQNTELPNSKKNN